MSENKKVSVVIAAYNEEPRIAMVLSVVEDHPLIDEVIVVDDGSVDKTSDVVKRFNVTLIENKINMGKTLSVKRGLEKIKNEVLILNTTCRATELRQKETAVLSKKVDIMIVIGGKNSANTNHIAEISRSILPDTYHIENADELDRKWFKGKKSAGICSGASTQMEDVISIKNIIESI